MNHQDLKCHLNTAAQTPKRIFSSWATSWLTRTLLLLGLTGSLSSCLLWPQGIALGPPENLILWLQFEDSQNMDVLEVGVRSNFEVSPTDLRVQLFVDTDDCKYSTDEFSAYTECLANHDVDEYLCENEYKIEPFSDYKIMNYKLMNCRGAVGDLTQDMIRHVHIRYISEKYGAIHFSCKKQDSVESNQVHFKCKQT